MIYIISVNRNTSGGSETLHQFAEELYKIEQNVSMFYIDKPGSEIPEKFKKYNVFSASHIEDNVNNILIVPETETSYLYRYKNIKKVIWWLSLDNYYGYTNIIGLVRSAQRHNISPILYPLYIPIVFIKKKITPDYFRFSKKDNNIFHLYNCEYVYKYLMSRGIKKEKCLYLCGPISNEYFINEGVEEKENLLLFNPKKNYKYTRQIIKRIQKERPDIKCVAIEHMTTSEIICLMDKAKVYIDFGQFPGPERIPREAVTRRCNIITSRYGSAGNESDVNIPDKYKFKANKENIVFIIKTIEELCKNHEKHTYEFEAYRNKVKKQKQLFSNNTKIFVNIMSQNEGD